MKSDMFTQQLAHFCASFAKTSMFCVLFENMFLRAEGENQKKGCYFSES